jgi:predicted transcriptional regulator
MTTQISNALGKRAKRILEAMNDIEWSARKLGDKLELQEGSCGDVLKLLVKKGYVSRRELSRYEKRRYENGHTKFVYKRVIKE